MCYFIFLIKRVRGGLYFLVVYKFLVLYNDKLFQAGHKKKNKKKGAGIKSFYSNTSYSFEYKKDCISKLSVKMFIKRKTRACLPNASKF